MEKIRRWWQWQLAANGVFLFLLIFWLLEKQLPLLWWLAFWLSSFSALVFLWADLALASPAFAIPFRPGRALVVWLRAQGARALFHHFWGQLAFLALFLFLWTSSNSLAGLSFLFFLAGDLIVELVSLRPAVGYRRIWQRQLKATFSGYNFARGVAFSVWLFSFLRLLIW